MNANNAIFLSILVLTIGAIFVTALLTDNRSSSNIHSLADRIKPVQPPTLWTSTTRDFSFLDGLTPEQIAKVVAVVQQFREDNAQQDNASQNVDTVK